MNAPLAKEQIALLMSDSLTYRVPSVQGTQATHADARPTGLSALLAPVVRAISTLVTFPRRRAVIDELSRLTDRELADIGLHRSELRMVFRPEFQSARRA